MIVRGSLKTLAHFIHCFASVNAKLDDYSSDNTTAWSSLLPKLYSFRRKSLLFNMVPNLIGSDLQLARLH